MKAIVSIALVVLFCIPVFALLPETSYKSALDFPRRYGVERVTNYDPRVNYGRIDTIVYLSPLEVEHFKGVGRGGYAPFYPRATAKIRSNTYYGYPTGNVEINTKDLPASDREFCQFEVWFVDEETGYRLSLGTFVTGFGGIGSLRYKSNIYLDPYDFVEISVEPMDDIDPTPGPIALIGRISDRIPPPQYYNPEPKSSKMVTSVFTQY